MTNFSILRWLFILLTLLLTTEGKGFGFGRGVNSKYKGILNRPGGYNRGHYFPGGNTYRQSYGTGIMSRPHGGSRFKNTAMGFAAGAAGGVMAYSLMKTLGRSHGYRHGYYDRGYGYGDTCFNNENMGGVIFGTFRCPLNGFPIEARFCCGPYGRQYCCTGREYYSYQDGK